MTKTTDPHRAWLAAKLREYAEEKYVGSEEYPHDESQNPSPTAVKEHARVSALTYRIESGTERKEDWLACIKILQEMEG